jgi:hypothetical protein
VHIPGAGFSVGDLHFSRMQHSPVFLQRAPANIFQRVMEKSRSAVLSRWLVSSL